MKTSNLFSFFTVLLLFFCNCNNGETHIAPNLFSDSALSFKVYERSSQQILLNGSLISLAELNDKIKALKKNGGIIFYSCPGATENPPAKSRVIELVKQHQIGLKMFTDSTFNLSFY